MQIVMDAGGEPRRIVARHRRTDSGADDNLGRAYTERLRLCERRGRKQKEGQTARGPIVTPFPGVVGPRVDYFFLAAFLAAFFAGFAAAFFAGAFLAAAFFLGAAF